jgi:dCMP deaminase
MNKQNQIDQQYLRMAQVWADSSYCQRKKVGCLIVKNQTIISDGYNGTPRGFDNVCESSEDGETLWHVLHAEANALTKIARSNQSSEGATLYTTLSPCKDCSKLILQSGITRVVYLNDLSDRSGLDFLFEAGIDTIKGHV